MRPLRVVVAHTYYRQAGGEDRVFHAEREILQSGGHEVHCFAATNAELDERAPLQLAARTVWNAPRARELQDLVKRAAADVVHVHNTFPAMSPSVLWAARRAGAAVVQTLHNYRLFCPAGTFLRQGKICMDCTRTAWPWPAVAHRCYRGSRAASLATAAMLTGHRAVGTWSRAVDAFIALSQHGRTLFTRLGLPSDRLHVKPNFLAQDPGLGTGGGGFGLFVGRLSEEKGVRVLLAAAERLGGEVPLRIVGTGPLENEVRAASKVIGGLEWLGGRSHEDVLDLMGRAEFLIVPSVWEEPFGRTVVESFARGTPVVASAAGALPELVEDGRTGVHVAPGDVEGLARRIVEMGGERGRAAGMRGAARSAYERAYTAEHNREHLERIYRVALAHRHRRSPAEIDEEVACAAPG